MKQVLSMVKAGTLLLVLLCIPLYLQAQAKVEMNTVAGTSGSAVFAKVAFSLILIVGVIFLCAWLAKRAGLMRFTGSNNFKVLANLPLGTREKMLLVQVGSNYLLLGVTTQQITLLKTFAEGDNPLQEWEKDTENASQENFASQLKKILSQGLSK